MRFAAHILLLSIAVTALPGCGIFGGGDDEELKPTELLDFEQTLAIRKLWSGKVGDGSEFLRLSLQPSGDGIRIYAASIDGVVSAFNPQNGKRLWRVDVDERLSAGPGVGEERLIVVTQQGEVVCLNTADGAEIWRSDIESESIAPPRLKNGVAVIATIDGKLRGLSLFDGAEKWLLEQALPPLTLRGTAVPAIVGSSVIAGFDNGRLLAAGLDDGIVEWETVLSQPTGRSDLERLADVDGAIAVVGQDVYAVGYHGRLAAIAAESGQILWSREISSYSGIGADWENIYTLSDDGEVIGLLRRNGSEVWRQTALVRREPTSPVSFDTAVAVGDFAGYVHLFDNGDGTPVARVRVGKGMISGAPVVIGGNLVVQNESGVIAVFAVKQAERPVKSNDQDENGGT
ncbi:MAG: outer membrane protein assembly factor BamB [Gammaproteobacteria bacterium]|nr:outer membrane protein assembly factor BamB [Gammaproteobacteria bacterium]